MRLSTAMEVMDVELNLMMCIIRLRLMMPLSRTTELMTRRTVWYSLGSDVFSRGAAVSGEELEVIMEVIMEVKAEDNTLWGTVVAIF